MFEMEPEVSTTQVTRGKQSVCNDGGKKGAYAEAMRPAKAVIEPLPDSRQRVQQDVIVKLTFAKSAVELSLIHL